MKVENIRTPEDIERYVEGCMNDYSEGISTKEETIVNIIELVDHYFKELYHLKKYWNILQLHSSNIHRSSLLIKKITSKKFRDNVDKIIKEHNLPDYNDYSKEL